MDNSVAMGSSSTSRDSSLLFVAFGGFCSDSLVGGSKFLEGDFMSSMNLTSRDMMTLFSLGNHNSKTFGFGRIV